MQEFAIPFASPLVRVVVGIPLGVMTALGLWWGVRMFIRSVRTKLGSPIFFGIVILASLGAGLLFLAVETTQPSIVSESGFIYGAQPPSYRAVAIPWSDVDRVECFIQRSGRDITGLVIYSHGNRYQFGSAGQQLETVREFIEKRVVSGAMAPCKPRFRD